jgi:hypothetical protein
VKNPDIQEENFIPSYTERGIVICEEIRVGNFSDQFGIVEELFDHGGLTENRW